MATVGVAAALCSLVLKKQTPELALALTLLAGAVILGFVLPMVGDILDFLQELARTAGLSQAVLEPVIKVTGIAIVARAAAELCRDAGESGLAMFVETAAAALAVLVTLPLLRTVLDVVGQLL